MTTMPFVHLNGTSPKELADQQRRVAKACQDLEKALQEATPHGRDYYHAEGIFEDARKEHRDCLQQVRAISDRAQSIALYVNNQVRR